MKTVTFTVKMEMHDEDYEKEDFKELLEELHDSNDAVVDFKEDFPNSEVEFIFKEE